MREMVSLVIQGPSNGSEALCGVGLCVVLIGVLFLQFPDCSPIISFLNLSWLRRLGSTEKQNEHNAPALELTGALQESGSQSKDGGSLHLERDSVDSSHPTPPGPSEAKCFIIAVVGFIAKGAWAAGVGV